MKKRSLYYLSGLALVLTAVLTVQGVDVKVTNNTESNVAININGNQIRYTDQWLAPKGKSSNEFGFSFSNRPNYNPTLTEITASVVPNPKQPISAQGWKGNIQGSFVGNVNFVIEATPGTPNKYRVVKQ